MSAAVTDRTPATQKTPDPQRLAFWVSERADATELMRADEQCPDIAVHIYATTPTLGDGNGTVAAAVCPDHGTALDFAGLDDDLVSIWQTVAEAFAEHGYLTVGGPP